MRLDLIGLKINTENKHQVLGLISERLKSGQKTFIATPYSEFFYYSAINYKFRLALAKTDLMIPDGISVLWLAHYLALPLRSKSYYAKVFEAFWQLVYTNFQILLAPRKIKNIIPEKITGAETFWDLVALAVQNNLRIFLLGGFGDTPEIVAEKVRQKFPNVQIAGYSDLNPGQIDVEQINSVRTDILIVAYGPVKQEIWIAENLERLKIKLAIGLGGTFDYIAGKKKTPPQFIRRSGLEWLYRLITQRRFKRIWIATYVFLRGALRHKVFNSMPLRPNVVSVIINQRNEIFAAVRKHYEALGTREPDWELPQGGVEAGESMQQAVLRESAEETGLQDLKILGQHLQTRAYMWQNFDRPLWFNKRKFKGQEQTIFYLRYSGDPNAVKLDPHELSEYKWLPKDQLKKIIHPVRQQLLDLVLAEIDKYLWTTK